MNREPCGSNGDWFDHKRYIKETLPRLLSIKPPIQVRCKKVPLVTTIPTGGTSSQDAILVEEEQKKPRLVVVPEGGPLKKSARSQKVRISFKENLL